MDRIIGVSDGVFGPLYAQHRDCYADRNVERLLKPNPTGVEVTLPEYEWWTGLESALEKYSNHASVRWISLHVTKSTINSFSNSLSFSLEMFRLVKHYGVSNIVIHADLLGGIEERNMFHLLPISVENTDGATGFGSSVHDVLTAMGKENRSDFGVTLDVQHLYGMDRLFNSLREFRYVFDGKVVEYHVSNWTDGRHSQLSRARPGESLILNSIQECGAPVVIEGACGSAHDYENEIAYVRSSLNRRGRVG